MGRGVLSEPGTLGDQRTGYIVVFSNRFGLITDKIVMADIDLKWRKIEAYFDPPHRATKDEILKAEEAELERWKRSRTSDR